LIEDEFPEKNKLEIPDSWAFEAGLSNPGVHPKNNPSKFFRDFLSKPSICPQAKIPAGFLIAFREGSIDSSIRTGDPRYAF